MKRKKLIKQMMALGFERNEAAVYASIPHIRVELEARVRLGEPGLHETKSELEGE